MCGSPSPSDGGVSGLGSLCPSALRHGRFLGEPAGRQVEGMNGLVTFFLSVPFGKPQDTTGPLDGLGRLRAE